MKLFHILFIVLLLAATFFWVQKNISEQRQGAITEAAERLKLTRDLRIAQLKNEVKTIYSEIRFWADSKPLKEGMDQMLRAWNELSPNPKARARQLYITDNPLYPNYTVDYNKADDGSSYSESHQKMHTLLKGLTRQRGYYDVFLIANNGDVIYSVYKEADYATNLLTGKYKDTNLARGFREVEDDTDLNHVSLFDYKAYAPSNNALSSFIQTSIIDNNNKTQGVLAFQLPEKLVVDVLGDFSNPDKGLKIYAVGADYLLRNTSKKQSINQHLNRLAIDKALQDTTGVEQLKTTTGKNMLTAFAPFEFSQNILGNTQKNNWAIIVEQDLSEILSPLEARIKSHLIWLLGLTIISLLFAWLITRGKEDLSTTEED